MSEFKFAENIERRGTNSSKWDFMPDCTDKEVLPMWVADMDIKCPDEVVKAVSDYAAEGIYGYSNFDEKPYFDTVRGWYARHYKHEIPAESMVTAVTVVSAFSFLIRLLTKAGEAVLIQTPVYPPFAGQISGTGREVVKNALVNKNGYYEIDFEDFERKIADENTKGFLLCSPHNPVGRAWKEDELSRMVALCKKYEKWIIADEIHCDLRRVGVKHIPTEAVDPSYKNSIYTCYSASKTFNLAGMGVCYTVIHDATFRQQFADFLAKDAMIGHASNFGILATTAAYEKGDAWHAGLQEFLDENAAYIDSFLKEHLPKVKFQIPEATYLAWLDFREYGLSDEELHRKLLTEAKVMLNPGHTFGEDGVGFARLNFACPRENLVECLERIKRVFG